LKPFLSPYANDFAHIIMNILRTLGIDANIYYLGTTPIITLPSLSGRVVQGAFVYGCMGVYSVLVFSILLVVILFEDPSSLKVKLSYSIVGLLGTFALNILRITIIVLADYFYGAAVGATVHYVIGYALFSTWLAIFFYVFSKRQVISGKFQSIWQKVRSSANLPTVSV
jgi:exosortase/archaeosortase family protein